jgi:3-dehydroquinate dehydratase-1
MIAHKSVKRRRVHSRIVGVIATRADLRLAMRMSDPPDLFELRLDLLVGLEKELEKKMPMLRAPLIITARHPDEGGANNLSLARRRELILRFLPRAQYVDLELRSVKAFQSLLDLGRRKNVRWIISFHDLGSGPNPRSLCAKARVAKSWGADIFKVAVRVDTTAQLLRLLDFASKREVDLPVSAMGIGKLGAVSRVLLAQCGSAFVYTSLSEPRIEGQIALEEFRAALRAFGIRLKSGRPMN